MTSSLAIRRAEGTEVVTPVRLHGDEAMELIKISVNGTALPKGCFEVGPAQTDRLGVDG